MPPQPETKIMSRWKVPSNLLVFENTVRKLSSMVLVLIFHVVGFRLSLCMTGSFTIGLSLVDFLNSVVALEVARENFGATFHFSAQDEPYNLSHEVVCSRTAQCEREHPGVYTVFSDCFLQSAFILCRVN